MISKLPHWVLIEKFPAFNDFESLTAIEQTARIYGKMNELIESYNEYVTKVNTVIEDYELDKYKEVSEFICRISCLTDNYINTVDMKIAHQDRQISEIYDRFSEDVTNTLKLLISDLKSSGELDNAIYESLDNINEKVDGFISECYKYKAELETDYTAKKTALETDYQNTKSQLDADYQTAKEDLEETVNTYVAQNSHLVIDENEEWFIKKFSDGTAQCWGKVKKSNIVINNTWGTAHYYGTIDPIELPDNLFIKSPILTITAEEKTGNVLVTKRTREENSSSTGYIYLVSPSQFTTDNPIENVTINIFAFGLWKTE